MLGVQPDLIDMIHLDGPRWHVVWRDRPDCYYVAVVEVTPRWEDDDRGDRYVDHVGVAFEAITVCDNDDERLGELVMEHAYVDPRLIVSMQPALRQAAERAAEDADRNADPHGV